MLQELREELVPIFKIPFERSLQNGSVANGWTSAKLSPLLKKGDKSCAAIYRPISLTCILCKVMEHIIASNLAKHLDTNGLMYDLQHGFRERSSCETQLASLVEDITRKSSQGKQTDYLAGFFKSLWQGQSFKVHLEIALMRHKGLYHALDPE